jgi:hypothetical protein
MERIYTQEELEIITQAEHQLNIRGVITEEGNPSSLHNLQLLITPFDKNPSIPVTVDGILSVANQLADKLEYKSKTAKQLALSQLTTAEWDELQDFLRRKPLVKLDGSNDGFHNSVLLVEWLRRYNYPINFPTLQKAMDGFAYCRSTDPKQLLRWLETTSTSPRGRWSQDDEPGRKPGQFFKPSEEERSSVYSTSGRKNHAHDSANQQTPATPVLDATEAAWKRMADAALVSGPQHHSARDERREAYDAAMGGSYRRVYEAVSKVVARQQQVRS